jgi:hypothetical protein
MGRDARQTVVGRLHDASGSVDGPVRPLVWLGRGEVTGRLHVRWNTRHGGPGPADDEQGFVVLRRLLHDRTIDPRDRLARSLLRLLYAQPITRAAALRTNTAALAADGQQLGRAVAGAHLRAAALARPLRRNGQDPCRSTRWREAATALASVTRRKGGFSMAIVLRHEVVDGFCSNGSIRMPRGRSTSWSRCCRYGEQTLYRAFSWNDDA